LLQSEDIIKLGPAYTIRRTKLIFTVARNYVRYSATQWQNMT